MYIYARMFVCGRVNRCASFNLLLAVVVVAAAVLLLFLLPVSLR